MFTCGERTEIRKLLEAYILGKVRPEFHENPVITKNGDNRAIRWFNTILKDADGNINGTLSSGEDITEQKKAVEMLRESEEKFRQLAEESPSMIFINKQDKVVYVNKKCEETTGYPREEIYSPTFDFRSLIAQESKELLTSSFRRHMMGEEVAPYECKLVTKQGKIIDAIINTKLIQYIGENAILGIVTDITEHKEMEHKLKEEHDKLESITENIGAGLVAISKDLRYYG